MIIAKPSLLQRAYGILTGFAVANFFLITALLTYAVMTGTLDREKLRRIAAVIQGRAELTAPAPAKPEAPAKNQPGAVPVDVSSPSAQDVGLLQREAERIKEELDQQLSLVHGMMLKVTTEREAFHREKAAATKQEEDSLHVQRQEGFRKQVEIYEGLSAKVAVEHLLALDDPDQAARVLAQLEPRKAKKIVEAARTVEQTRRMQEILKRVQEVAPGRSEELTAKDR